MSVDPTVSLCMIVRNEEQNLPRCLESVRGVVDEIIVVDTGSTDRTVAIAESLGARVLHFPWIGDFAAARNVGVDSATCEWILVLDADEKLHTDDRHRLKEICSDPDVEAYSMLHVNLIDAGGVVESENSYDVTLWRHRPEYRYEGMMHEQIVVSILKHRPGAQVEYCHDIRVIHYGYMQQAVRSHKKAERNLALARRLVAEHPDDVFYRFNLGLELQRIGELEAAVAEYERVRAGLSFWPLWASKMFKSLAACLLVLKRYDEAEAVSRHGLAIYPGFTDLVYLQGTIAQEQGRYARAVGCYQRCIAMGPAADAGGWPGLAGFRAYEALGRSYAAMGQVEAALEAYDSAYRVQPDWMVPLAAMVEVMTGQVGDESLIAYLRRYLDPAQPAGRIRLADILCAGDRPDLTLRILGESREAEALFLRGRALMDLGRYEEALFSLTAPELESVAFARVPLLAATMSARGREGLMDLVRSQPFTASDVIEAARLLERQASFWERRSRREGKAADAAEHLHDRQG